MEEEEKVKKKFSRREFLYMMGFVISAVALAVYLNRDDLDSALEMAHDFLSGKEVIPKGYENIAMIDFAFSREVPGLSQQETWTHEDFLEQLGMEKQEIAEGLAEVAKILAEGGVDALDHASWQKELIESHPRFALGLGVSRRFEDHGVNVFTSMRKTWAQFGVLFPQRDIGIIPLQQFAKPGTFKLDSDALQNNMVSFVLPAESVIEAVRSYIGEGDIQVLNLSFQFGKIGFTFVEREITSLYQPLVVEDDSGEEVYYPISIEYREIRKGPGWYSLNRYFITDEEGALVELEKLSEEQMLKYMEENPEARFKTASRQNPESRRIEILYYCPVPEDYKGEIVVKEEYYYPDGRAIPALNEEEMRRYMQDHQGEVELLYPGVRIQDAYTPDRAVENLRELFKFCNAFPDVMICAALGNTKDDIRAARTELAEEWPENLMIAGEWGRVWSELPDGDCYGADVYVELKPLGIESYGSSNATPVISSIFSELLRRGLSIPEAKEELLSFCREATFEVEGEQVKAQVLAPEKVRF